MASVSKQASEIEAFVANIARRDGLTAEQVLIIMNQAGQLIQEGVKWMAKK